MTQQIASISNRQNLRNRIRDFCRHLEESDWRECFKFIDPQLRNSRIDLGKYSASMSRFRDACGAISFLSIAKLTVYEGAVVKQEDKRPFAYCVVVWEDKSQTPHVTRQRWVKARGIW